MIPAMTLGLRARDELRRALRLCYRRLRVSGVLARTVPQVVCRSLTFGVREWFSRRFGGGAGVPRSRCGFST